MSALPRLLVLIGSGETAAQMTRGHRMIARRLAGEGGDPSAVKAAIVDTPYGFQSNADALSAGLVDYFRDRIGISAQIASFRRSDDDVLTRETAFARIREADFVFSGPGSASYALRHWSDSPIPSLFAQKLSGGGALLLASAAALTVGRVSVPVYEIYKAGEDPYWLPGLDVLSTIGINAAVIPHYDNTEGGGHDTRFSFLGERKLAMLEPELPEGGFILGIDEHTALLIDIDHETAYVHGRGGVTIRRQGRDAVYPSGEQIALSELRRQSKGARVTTPTKSPAPDSGGDHVLAQRLLTLEERMASMTERARLVEPLIEELIDLRRGARSSGDYVTADAIRDRLVALGVEINDAADGTTQFRLSSDGHTGRRSSPR